MVIPFSPSRQAMRSASAQSSLVAEAGMLTVLLIEAWTCRWKLACIRTWSCQEMSSAVLKSLRNSSGSQGRSWTVPVSWTWETTSSARAARSSPDRPIAARTRSRLSRKTGFTITNVLPTVFFRV